MVPGTNPTEKVDQKKVGEKSISWYFIGALMLFQ